MHFLTSHLGRLLGTDGAPITIHLTAMIVLIFLAAVLVSAEEHRTSAE